MINVLFGIDIFLWSGKVPSVKRPNKENIMSDSDEFRNDPFPDEKPSKRFFETMISAMIVLLWPLMAVLVIALTVKAVQEIFESEPELIDHCHPTNWK